MDDVFTILINFLLLVGIWWLYFIGYRSYRLDKTRQMLFAIRDQLFEDWAARQLPFNSKAYVIMRTTLNGMIRFAHRASIIRVIVAVTADRHFQGGAISKRYETELTDAVAELSPEVREVVQKAQMEMHSVMIDHLVKSSIILQLLLVLVTVLLITNRLRARLLKWWSPAIDAEAQSIGHAQQHGSSTSPAEVGAH